MAPRIHDAGRLEVWLPLTPAPAEDMHGEQAASVPGRRILLVEDNADAGQSLRDLLEVLGHEVTVMETGTEALAVLSSRGADLVLCDLGLPGMSGYDVARAVRGERALRETPLVALTGYGQPEHRQRTADAGFDAHLTKPVDIAALNAVLDRLGHR